MKELEEELVGMIESDGDFDIAPDPSVTSLEGIVLLAEVLDSLRGITWIPLELFTNGLEFLQRRHPHLWHAITPEFKRDERS